MYVNFLAAAADRTIDGTTVNEKGAVDFGTGGKVDIINGGTLNLGVALAAKVQESGSPINVTNGTINFGDGNKSGANNYTTFMLTNAAANVNIGGSGTMNLNQTGGTLIDNTQGPGSLISNSGVVNLNGVTGGTGTFIAAPLQNHGTLNILGGDWTFSQKDAKGNDLSMDAGSINLSFNPPSIYCLHQYTQTGGTFFVDTSQALLSVTAGGSANFNGGMLSFGLSNGVLNTNSIVFNGATLNMSITANSTTSNVINCKSCSIKGSSTINVTLVGEQTVYDSWELIQSAAMISGDFQTVNLPSSIFESEPGSNWSCYSTD